MLQCLGSCVHLTAGLIDGGCKPKRLQRYDEPGEKARYFADDDAQDLAALVKRQRYEGAEDIDAHLADNIARKATYKWVPTAEPHLLQTCADACYITESTWEAKV